MDQKLVVGSFNGYPIEAVCTVSNQDMIVVCKGLVGSYHQARSFINRYNHREINFFGFNEQRSEIKDDILNSDKINIACLNGTREELSNAVDTCKSLLGTELLLSFESYEKALEYSNQFKTTN